MKCTSVFRGAAFAATFAVTEHGLSPDVPERQLRMDVAFLAPQRFRLDVHDETTYPSTRWTPTASGC